MTLDGPAILEHALIRIEANGQLLSTADLELRGELVVLGRLEATRLLTNVPGGMTNSGEIVAQSYLALKAPYTNSGSVVTQDSLWIYSVGDLNNTGSFDGGTVGLGPLCYNYGQVTAQNFTTGYLLNYGTATADSVDFRNSVLVNAGFFHGQRIYAANNIENEAEGTLTCDQLYQEGTLDNYGVLRVFGTFHNGSDTAQGDSQFFTGSTSEARNFINHQGSVISGLGTLCIAENSENHGAVNGPIGVCDITPGSTTVPYMDINTGTVTEASFIVQCPSGTCGTVGLSSHAEATGVTLFPQPATDDFVVDLGGSSRAVQHLLLFDAQGSIVLSNAGPFQEKVVMATQGIAPGFYLLVGLDRAGLRSFTTPVLLE